MAKKAAKIAEAVAYEHGLVETEAKLTAEVTVVCRDYCAETYYKALDRAGVPTDSDLRKADKVYYPEDIRKDPTALLLLSNLSSPKTLHKGLKYQQGFQKRKRVMWGSLG